MYLCLCKKTWPKIIVVHLASVAHENSSTNIIQSLQTNPLGGLCNITLVRHFGPPILHTYAIHCCLGGLSSSQCNRSRHKETEGKCSIYVGKGSKKPYVHPNDFDDLSLLHIKCPKKKKKKTTSLLVEGEIFVNNVIDDVMKITISSFVQVDNDYAMER